VNLRFAILGTRGIPAAYGGFETFAEQLATRLVKLGIDVTVYCEGDGRNAPHEFRGIQLRYVPTKLRGPLTTIAFDVSCLWDARKDFDIVYMLGYGAAPFMFIPRLFGTIVWLNVDGIEWRRAKWGGTAKTYFRIMEYFSTKTANRIIADAEAIQAHFRLRHGDKFKCSVIPYGAPIVENRIARDQLGDFGIEPGQYYLVVCRLEPENHVYEIIRGYLQANPSLPLVIVGNHQVETAYTKQLVSLSSEKVRFVGAIFDQAKLEAIRVSCRAYIHGHSVGGTNPSLLEAMGCGNAVIAHDNVFNREVLGTAGTYFRSSVELAAVLSEFEVLSADQLATFRIAAKERILNRYDWNGIVSQYFDLITSTGARKSPSQSPS
jgi:glycosyltransferase involved in cell wall biosynthesis